MCIYVYNIINYDIISIKLKILISQQPKKVREAKTLNFLNTLFELI